MDPASITALIGVCVTILRNATGFVSGLDSVITRIQDASLDITAVQNRCEGLSLATRRLRAWLDEEGNQLKEGERAFLMTALDVCNQLIDKLNGVTRKCGSVDKKKKPGPWKVVRFLFSQPQLAKYEAALHSQMNSIHVILRAVNLETAADRRKALRAPENRKVLKKAISIASDTSSDLEALSEQLDCDLESDLSALSSAGEAVRPEELEADSGYGGSANARPRAGAQPAALPLTERNLKTLNKDNPEKPLPVPWAPDAEGQGALDPNAPSVVGKEPEPRGNEAQPAQIVAAGAPGGDDEPDDSSSDSTARGGENSEPPPRPPGSVDSALRVRDELRRINGEILSGADEERMAAIQRSLRRVCNLMGQLGNPADLPDGLMDEINQLLPRVTADLRRFYDADERLLQGDNITATNAMGETALHIAARTKSFDHIGRLLRLGASTAHRDTERKTPLQSLLSPGYRLEGYDHVRAVVHMLEREADPNVRHQVDGSTLLHTVAAGGHAQLLEPLLAHGADPRATDRAGNTPLILACRRAYLVGDCVLCAEILIESSDGFENQWAQHQEAIGCVLDALLVAERGIIFYRTTVEHRQSIHFNRRSIDGALALLELLLSSNGVGSGHLTPAAKRKLSSIKIFRSFDDGIRSMRADELKIEVRRVRSDVLMTRDTELHAMLTR